jgi:dihydrofolate synthase/folylpolyglutamate synthase
MDVLVDHWHFCDLPTPRAAAATALEAQWRSVSKRQGVTAQTHASPVLALAAAVAAAGAADRIVAFGSFFTVGAILDHGIPRLDAKHIAQPPAQLRT